MGGKSLAIALSALALFAANAALVSLSGSFVYGSGHAARPIIAVVVVLVAAGIAWAVAVRQFIECPAGRLGTAGVILFSLLLAAMQLPSDPVQSTDFYRYLVDGGVTACGENPYRLSPAEQLSSLKTLAALSPTGSVASQTGCLSADPGWPALLSRVDLPEAPTPYPPLAALWFAATVKVAGPSLLALRVSFLLATLALLVLLAQLLKELGLSPLLVATVGWCPLLFKEIFNSGHYDILPALLLVAAALAFVRRRPAVALGLLGAVVSLKLFALLLLPLWLRATPGPARLRSLGAFTLGVLVFYLPFATAGSHLFAGQLIYAGQAAAHGPLFGPGEQLITALGAAAPMARLIAWAILALVVVSIVGAYPLGEEKETPRRALGGSLLVLAVLLLGGPAPNPWYFVWLLPLIALRPRPAWLALIVMSPLYYLHFHLVYHGMEGLQTWVTTARFLPFAVLLIWQIFIGTSRRQLRE
ncbi:MAG: hypothetical protein VCA74_06905 [Deltaproteobacteria bacterium]